MTIDALVGDGEVVAAAWTGTLPLLIAARAVQGLGCGFAAVNRDRPQ